jgi:DNA polymerase-3 subunit gamma/tau
MAGEEGVSFEPEALQIIAQKADGGLRDACSIFDQMVAFTGNHLTYKQVVDNLNVLDYDYYFKITDSFINQNLSEIMVTFDDILRKGFDGHNFLIGLGEHLRNILVSKDPQTISLIEVSENLRQRYLEQSQKCNLNFLLKSLALISKTDVNYKSAKNQRLLVEMTLMQLTFLTASLDAEKKNDEQELNRQNNKESSVSTSKTDKPTSFASEVKIADKPVIPFDQLKIKAEFILNESKIQPVIKNEVAKQDPASYNANRIENKDVTISDVKKVITDYAKLKQEKGSRLFASSLLSAEIFFENNTIKLKIYNESQKENLLEHKQIFLDDIRKDLQNNSIGLEIEVSINELQTKAYKPHDIYNIMSEKNPVLHELKKRFDCEIDY